MTPARSFSSRYNYSLHGRQETITFRCDSMDGITLVKAHQRLNEAKKMVSSGRSPAQEKARDKARIKDEESFGAWAQ